MVMLRGPHLHWLRCGPSSGLAHGDKEVVRRAVTGDAVETRECHDSGGLPKRETDGEGLG
jgi:hypothetical protein